MDRPAELTGSSDGAPHRWRPLYVALAVAVLVALFLAGYLPRRLAAKSLAASTAAAASDVPRVVVIQPRIDSNVRTLALPGNIQALEATAVYARANGYVRRWLVDIGDHVTEGQLLAEIDTPDLDQQLQQARATLGQMKASLEQAAANQRYAATTAQRYETLVEQHFVSRQDADQTRAQADVGLANVHAAESGILAQNANVHQLEQLKAFGRVTAPFGGTITERNIDRGALVTPGSASGKPLYMIAISNPLRVSMKVPQPFSAGIAVGAAVTVRVRQYPGRDFPGKITRSSGALDPATRTLDVEAEVANDKGDLFPGAYAEVTFPAGLSHGVAVIPASALVVDARGTHVATVDVDGKAHFIPVQVGRDQGLEVEIVDGLHGKENVIATPTSNLVEGTPVTAAASPAP
jgi:membrane fusion protein (multidrug efflux system)